MDDLDLAAESLADKVQRFSAFIGVTKPTPRDKFFLVMGMTGSGKSTFVARCTGHAVTIGHGLYSCTNSIDVFKFSLKGRNIYLIDTPGFNDTNRSDIDTLEILAAYLGASYANGVRIHGIIFLHPISDNRISGSSLRNIEMLKAVCGFTSYDNLAIATTMWPDGPALDEKTKLEQRETELVTDERFFGSLVARGAKMFRHKESDCRDNNKETASAHCILIHLIHQLERSQPSALHLQREIIDQGKALSHTAAGIVAASYLHKARCEHEHRLKELKAEMSGQLANAKTTYTTQLQELKMDFEKKLEKAEDDQRVLKRTMQDMHEAEARAWEKKLEDMDKRMREHLAAKEQEVLDLEESLDEVRKDRDRRFQRLRQEQQLLEKRMREGDKQIREHIAAKEAKVLDLQTYLNQQQRDHYHQQQLLQQQQVLQQQQALQQHQALQQQQALQEQIRQLQTRQQQLTLPEDSKHDEIIQNARREAAQARKAYERLRGKKDNIMNGTLNGVAAGMTSGVIAAVASSGILCTVM